MTRQCFILTEVDFPAFGVELSKVFSIIAYISKWLYCLLWCRAQVDSWACNSNIQRNYLCVRLWSDGCFRNCRGGSRCQSFPSHLPVICYHFVISCFYLNSWAKLKDCTRSPCGHQDKMSWLNSNVDMLCFARSAVGSARRQWHLKLPRYFWYCVVYVMLTWELFLVFIYISFKERLSSLVL